MPARQEFEKSGRFNEYKLQLLTSTSTTNNKHFDCGIPEYNDYLFNDALRSQNDHIALTWLLTERATDKIVAYMSLIMDSIKLSFTEKELHNLNYPFKTIPSMKIAKLAVDTSFSKLFKGIGMFMNLNRANCKLAKVPLLIDSAQRLAWSCNENYCSARFLTVDADIEHDEGVLAFYQ